MSTSSSNTPPMLRIAVFASAIMGAFFAFPVSSPLAKIVVHFQIVLRYFSVNYDLQGECTLGLDLTKGCISPQMET